MADERKTSAPTRGATSTAGQASTAEAPAAVRPDEGAVGGRYVVDGRLVDAAGEPRTDA